MSRLSTLSRSIAGSVALITGAASGMGRATAQLFADEGAKLVLLDINDAGLRGIASELEENGCQVLAISVDCGDQDKLTAAVRRGAEHFDRMDIIINNAGLSRPGAITDDEFDSNWDTSMAIMAAAQQWTVLAALPWLKKAANPRIVNVASTEALGATNYNAAYVAAKHASLGLTRALAMELGKLGITVNAVCPGPIHTGITAAIPDEHKQIYANRRTALRRYGYPEEVAHITLGLVLPAASFITGAAIPVDGGLTIRNA